MIQVLELDRKTETKNKEKYICEKERKKEGLKDRKRQRMKETKKERKKEMSPQLHPNFGAHGSHQSKRNEKKILLSKS